MSLTVFLALCVLGADFMIYCFFKLLYSERRRTRPRRLPREYYSNEEKTSPLDRSPARKSHAISRATRFRPTGPPRIISISSARTPGGVARVGNAGMDILEGRG